MEAGRLNAYNAAPDAMRAVQRVEAYIQQCGLEKRLIADVRRAQQGPHSARRACSDGDQGTASLPHRDRREGVGRAVDHCLPDPSPACLSTGCCLKDLAVPAGRGRRHWGSAEKIRCRDGRSSLGPGEFADRGVPGRELSRPSRYLCRSEWQGPALYARKRPYYGTYPGLRVPRPLLLVPHEHSDSSILALAKDVMALTKVNWSTTQFDQKFPAPIKAAREVGRILKHIEYGTAVSPTFGNTRDRSDIERV